MKITDLIKGEEYWTDDGYGSDRIEILEEAQRHEDWAGLYVLVKFVNEPEREPEWLGGIDTYLPDFWPVGHDE